MENKISPFERYVKLKSVSEKISLHGITYGAFKDLIEYTSEVIKTLESDIEQLQEEKATIQEKADRVLSQTKEYNQNILLAYEKENLKLKEENNRLKGLLKEGSALIRLLSGYGKIYTVIGVSYPNPFDETKCINHEETILLSDQWLDKQNIKL